MSINIISATDYADLSRKAAGIIAAQVLLKPDCVLGLATGSSPLGLYAELIKKYKAGELDFSRVRSVNLDEYDGLTPDHDQSYAYFMRTNLFDHINIDQEDCNIPSGIAEDGELECARYDDLIDELGGIDLQLLGLGHNGHIGFNEPDDRFIGETHRVELTPETIAANARFFKDGEPQPTAAFTMGMRAILGAKKVLLIVSGEAKAQILRDCLCGPITPRCPASILQLHSDVTVVADAEALSKLLND